MYQNIEYSFHYYSNNLYSSYIQQEDYPHNLSHQLSNNFREEYCLSTSSLNNRDIFSDNILFESRYKSVSSNLDKYGESIRNHNLIMNDLENQKTSDNTKHSGTKFIAIRCMSPALIVDMGFFRLIPQNEEKSVTVRFLKNEAVKEKYYMMLNYWNIKEKIIYDNTNIKDKRLYDINMQNCIQFINWIEDLTNKLLKVKNPRISIRHIDYDIKKDLFSNTKDIKNNLNLELYQILSNNISPKNTSLPSDFNRENIENLKKENNEELNRFFQMSLIKILLDAIIFKNYKFQSQEYNDILKKYYIEYFVEEKYNKFQKKKEQTEKEEEDFFLSVLIFVNIIPYIYSRQSRK